VAVVLVGLYDKCAFIFGLGAELVLAEVVLGGDNFQLGLRVEGRLLSRVEDGKCRAFAIMSGSIYFLYAVFNYFDDLGICIDVLFVGIVGAFL
jgi:hypothetical protein